MAHRLWHIAYAKAVIVRRVGGGSILLYLSIGWLRGQWINNRPIFTLGVLLLILGVQSAFFGVLAELIVVSRCDMPRGYRVRRVARGLTLT